jgi:ABC-2 type transport system permease protein
MKSIRRLLRKSKDLFKHKKFKHGGMSVIFIAIFITAIIMVNIITGMVLDRLDIRIDLTADRRFSIEPETVKFLESLDDDVTIIVTSTESEFADFNEWYNQVNEILKRFAGASQRINLRYVDLMSNPDYANRYENLDSSTIIFESANTGRHEILATMDYLQVEYYDIEGNPIPNHMVQTYATFGLLVQDVSTSAESAFLTAILSVTDISPVHVAILTGHGESRLPHIEHLLNKYAYHVHEINIMTSDISDEIDFVIINSPTSDYSIPALSRLRNWLQNDEQFGKTLIYISPVAELTPNLDVFLLEWGISVEREYVWQRDPRFAAPAPTLMMNNQFYVPHDYTAGFNPGYEIYGELMRRVTRTFDAQSNIKTRPLLTSYQGAVLMPFSAAEENSTWNPDTAQAAAWDVAVHSWKIRFEGTGFDSYEVHSNVFAFGSSRPTMVGNGNVFNSYFMELGNSNNTRFFINLMNSISGKDEIYSEIIEVLAPKSFTVASFAISQSTSELIGIMFILVLPLVIIAAGFVVWIRRIRK